MKYGSVFAWLWLSGLLFGCAGRSEAPDFYQLTMHGPVNVASDFSHTIVVEPIKIPEILKRTQIVSYGSEDSQLLFSDYHLWAADLRDMLSETTVSTLRQAFPKASVYSFSGQQSPENTYRIAIQLDEFAGRLGDICQLRALWKIENAKGAVLLSQRAEFSESAIDDGYRAYVNTLNQLVVQLNDRLVKSIQSLP